MEKLLHWSIAQQAGDKEALSKIGTPDPKALNQLFGGPDEASLMKESVMVVENPEVSNEDKIIALENLEMLIENLDNANNIENLKLWLPLLNILGNDSYNDEIRTLILSIIGIAVQNNNKSQSDFNKYDQGIKLLIELGEKSQDLDLKLKALFAISSFIRDYKPGYEKFEQLNGWNLITLDIKDNSPKLNLRVLSLIASILSNGLSPNTEAHLRKNNIGHKLAILLNDDAHPNLIDKTLNIISNLYHLKYEFTPEEKYEIDAGLETIEGLSDRLNLDDLETAKMSVSK
ncbi:unnamed protein product [Candida verbasci]|uniref:Hsp70 nucleotide exchange factor FES1 n=1 Tax=Candida verbasci TaxID=1227364 RepID=A0A9W4XIW4_9ASCO|nr:unnamed protein product [Candida verbasci]